MDESKFSASGQARPRENLCNKMFKDSSGTIAKTWKEPKYPPTDE